MTGASQMDARINIQNVISGILLMSIWKLSGNLKVKENARQFEESKN